VRAVLIIDLGVELDEGDTLDTDLMTAEIRHLSVPGTGRSQE